MPKITINIPDKHVPMLLDIIEEKTEMARLADEAEPVPFTKKYAIDWLKQYLMDSLTKMVKRHRKRKLVQEANSVDLELS